MSLHSKADAQQRADQINAFRSELAILEKEQIVSLNARQHELLNRYHSDLLRQLRSVHDVDINPKEKQLSLGMKIASFIGALALSASLFFLFYQFWGYFSLSMQVSVLVATPLLGVLATAYVSGRETTGYFSKLLGLFTFAAFALNIAMVAQLFNMTASPNIFAVLAACAFLLAYAADSRLLLAAGILSMAAFLSAKTGTWSGAYWIHFGERPENFFPVALLLFCPSLLPRQKVSGFSEIYRIFGMIFFFLPVLILSNWGVISYLDVTADTVEIFYQLVGFMVSAAAIALGIKNNWSEVVNTGNIFLTLFIYTKFFDWWWEWMPKYLFFFIIALTSVLILVVFKKLRDDRIFKVAKAVP